MNKCTSTPKILSDEPMNPAPKSLQAFSSCTLSASALIDFKFASQVKACIAGSA